MGAADPAASTLRGPEFYQAGPEKTTINKWCLALIKEAGSDFIASAAVCPEVFFSSPLEVFCKLYKPWGS